MVRALEAAGNTVWVEDPLFTPDELRGAGFRVHGVCDEDSQGDEKQDKEVMDTVIIDRQKALNLIRH